MTEASAVTTRDIFRRPQPSTVPKIRLVLPPVPLKTVLVLDVSQVSKDKSLSTQCYLLMWDKKLGIKLSGMGFMINFVIIKIIS